MPVVEDVEEFVARGEFGDDRHITHQITFDWEPFLLFFKRRRNVAHTYRDTTGAAFTHLGGDRYQHAMLGSEYTRDRTIKA